jgi:hypothetical protein
MRAIYGIAGGIVGSVTKYVAPLTDEQILKRKMIQKISGIACLGCYAASLILFSIGPAGNNPDFNALRFFAERILCLAVAGTGIFLYIVYELARDRQLRTEGRYTEGGLSQAFALILFVLIIGGGVGVLFGFSGFSFLVGLLTGDSYRK